MPDLWTVDELPGIAWEPDLQPDPTPDMRAAERRDLWKCGLTAHQMQTITTVKITGGWL